MHFILMLCSERENLGKPEEGKYKTESTDDDTYLEHVLGLDETS